MLHHMHSTHSALTAHMLHHAHGAHSRSSSSDRMAPIQRGVADAAAARRRHSQPPPHGEFMRATSPLHASVSNSTYGLTTMPHGYASDTFWSEPLPDAPPYRHLVERLLAPLGRQVTRADVLRATWNHHDAAHSTCAIARVAKGEVCKVRVEPQRLEKTHHLPQETSLLRFIRELLPLPDLEIAYCPGDINAIVADAFAARDRWNGWTGCTPGTVYRSAALMQFRCQAKAYLPFFFWYRPNVFGSLADWDATTSALRARASALPWASRAPLAFFRGSINENMSPHACLRAPPHERPTRCELLHASVAQPSLIDYKVGPNTSRPFAQWARHKYVLFMEGTEEWADRLKLLLQLGSVVLVQELWCNEYYFWMMRPWVHYVPVSTRMEDLVDTVRWLRAHDAVAQRIGAAGQRFAAEHLSLANVRTFHRELLLGYAARFDASDDGGWPRGGCPAAPHPLKRRTLRDLNGPPFRYCRRAPR